MREGDFYHQSRGLLPTLQTVLAPGLLSQMFPGKPGGNGEGKPSLDRVRLMPNDKKVLALSSEEEQIMEVPSCKIRAIVASDSSWPWAETLVRPTLQGPGCHQVTSLQLFPALPASLESWSLLTADSAAGILEDLHTPSWFVSAMK